MIEFRPFLNSDPPALAAIWRGQPASRALMQPMTAALFDDLVLAKPYFDRAGLVVALHEGEPVGFAHAGFGPNAVGSALDPTVGTICQLMICQDAHCESIAPGLVEMSENYLRRHGATTVYGGAIGELAPFYMGLYGGGLSPGVLASDTAQTRAFRDAGYKSTSESTVFECELTGFRPVVDRQMMQIRRQYQVVPSTITQPTSWWDACHWGQIETVRFDLQDSASGTATRFARFWDIEPLASSWGRHAVALIDVNLDETASEVFLLTHLLGQAMREFQSRGVSLVEVQVQMDHTELSESCQRLGFKEVDQGLRFSSSRLM